jgi:hypothetical protein
MEKKEGHVRYKHKRDSDWTGNVARDILTNEQIQLRRFMGDIFEEDFSYIPELVIPSPPKERGKTKLKKSELEKDVNYILCPDKSCGLFWDERFKMACESYCPQKEKMEKMIVCHNCKEPIYLPHNHSSLCRVDHLCEDKRTPAMFTRMSGKYHLLYQKPK